MWKRLSVNLKRCLDSSLDQIEIYNAVNLHSQLQPYLHLLRSQNQLGNSLDSLWNRSS